MTKLKLTKLNQGRLEDVKMKMVTGGGTPGDCCCGCLYANSGGSSDSANGSANNAGGKKSVDSFWCDTGTRV